MTDWTDLESHHIEGFAREGNVAFKVELISHIEGNLWTGGCFNHATLPARFGYVVSLYPWEAYRVSNNGLERPVTLSAPLLDHGALPDLELLHRIADWVVWALDRGPTLVHCQAGLNRSGLVAALALYKRGYTAKDAVALLREKRCSAVLCNKKFETYLYSLDGDPLAGIEEGPQA